MSTKMCYNGWNFAKFKPQIIH